MLKDDVAASRAQITAVLKKSQFDKILLAKVDKIYDQALRVILKHLDDLGKLALQYAIDNISNSPASGVTYVYLNKDNEEVERHTSSAPGEAPASASEDLINSLAYRKNPDGWVEVGVFNNDLGGWPTFKYLGHGNLKLRKEYGDDVRFVRYGGKLHNIRKYAFYLEYGTDGSISEGSSEEINTEDEGSGEGGSGGTMAPRPFLAPAMVKAVKELKEDLYSSMKEAVANVVGRKNPPIYFRLKVKN